MPGKTILIENPQGRPEAYELRPGEKAEYAFVTADGRSVHRVGTLGATPLYRLQRYRPQPVKPIPPAEDAPLPADETVDDGA